LTLSATSSHTQILHGIKQCVTFIQSSRCGVADHILQYHSPYFNETHVALREDIRAWVEEKLMPNVTEWDEAKNVPDEIFRDLGDRGYLAGLLGMHYPTQYTDKRVKCVPPEKWDHFHEMIVTDELSRTGSGGLVWNLLGGYGIGAPPLFKFGKPELVKRIGPGLLSGEKRICLAITEPGKCISSTISISRVLTTSQMPVAMSPT
jgi:alkylation response protein AidB-like acyl-CoA dehydrogenase